MLRHRSIVLLHVKETSPLLEKGVYNFEFPMFNEDDGSKICTFGGDLRRFTSRGNAHYVDKALILGAKLILQKWISPAPPTHKQWGAVLNLTLQREKCTYKHRGCLQIFLQIWSWWVDSNKPLVDAPLQDEEDNN